MSFETARQPEGNDAKLESFEHKKLRVRNEIQRAIMSLVCSPDDGVECFIKWADENGSKFEKVFKRVVEADPAILDKWEAQRESCTTTFMSELELEEEERRAA